MLAPLCKLQLKCCLHDFFVLTQYRKAWKPVITQKTEGTFRTTHTRTPGSQHSGHKSSPCAWRHTLEERAGWGHSHLGRRGCCDCCREAASGRGRAEPSAGTEHSCKLPSLQHGGLRGKKSSVCWMQCGAPCGWCEEDSNAPPEGNRSRNPQRPHYKYIWTLYKKYSFIQSSSATALSWSGLWLVEVYLKEW